MIALRKQRQHLGIVLLRLDFLAEHLLKLFFLLLISMQVTYAEGTRQLEPYGTTVKPTELTKLRITNNAASGRVLFAQVGCPEPYRLNVFVNDLAETIYFGINAGRDSLYYQFRDPDNNVVPGFSLSRVPQSGAGYISSYNEAISGPKISGGNPIGYTPLILTPTKTGNYYIEFASNASGAAVSDTQLTFFDITVAKGNKVIDGRLWSKAWQINSGSGYFTIPPTTQSFAKFYIYASDSIVTQLDLNGLCGGIYTIYCNYFGVTNTGNWFSDRRSVNRFPSTGDSPQYKIFLNDPDPECFPTGRAGEICALSSTSYCDGTVDILLKVNKPGSVSLHLDCPPAGLGPEDLDFSIAVKGSGNCSTWDTIRWNGLDKLQQMVHNGAGISMDIDYINGLTNLPLWDVESAYQGIKVDLVRPLPPSGNTKLPLFWDDSGCGGTTNTLTGCIYPASSNISGCHNFPDSPPKHDQMVNTWWFYNTKATIHSTLVVKRLPSTPPMPSGPLSVCPGQPNVAYAVPTQLNTEKYIWYLPDGRTDTTTVPKIFFGYPDLEIPLKLSVKGWNAACGYGEVSTELTINPIPKISGPAEACQKTLSRFSTIPGLIGYQWSVSEQGAILGGNKSNSITVFWNSAGDKTVQVLTNSENCPSVPTLFQTLVHPTPTPDIAPSDTIWLCDFRPFVMESKNTYKKYAWQDGDTSMVYITRKPGTYSLTVVDNFGCMGSDVVVLEPCIQAFFAPNAFAPGNPEKNNIFRILDNGLLHSSRVELLIYNRWGEKVFEGNGIRDGWDGTHHGQPCPAGIYVYRIILPYHAIDFKHVAGPLSGTFMLVR